jgi:hypothetical protein
VREASRLTLPFRINLIVQPITKRVVEFDIAEYHISFASRLNCTYYIICTLIVEKLHMGS